MDIEVDESPSIALGLKEHELSFLDALPYIDSYDESDRSRALKLVELELLKSDFTDIDDIEVSFDVCNASFYDL